MNSATPTLHDASAKSPFAGCAIFIAAFCMMVFLIGFSTWALFRQFREIEKFTEIKPAPTLMSLTTENPTNVAALQAKLARFYEEISLGNAFTSVTLTADEVNLAIAHYDEFKELRNTFFIQSFGNNEALISISFPMNGKPRLARKEEKGWVTSDSRYLNGLMKGQFGLLKHELVLSIHAIEQTPRPVASEFIGQMSPYRLCERYLSHPQIGKVMKKLTHASVRNGNLYLERDPSKAKPDDISDATVKSASSRLFTFLGIAAVIFLAFVALILILGLRKTKAS